MCNPLVVGAAFAAMSAISKGAELGKKNEMAEKMGQSASDSLQMQYEALAKRERQVNDKASMDKLARSRQALREQSKLRVAMGEAGIMGGASPVRLLNDAMIQGTFDKGIIDQNKENRIDQIQYQKKQAYSQANARIARAESMVSSPLMSTMSIGMAGLKGFASGYLGASAAGFGETTSNITVTDNLAGGAV